MTITMIMSEMKMMMMMTGPTKETLHREYVSAPKVFYAQNVVALSIFYLMSYFFFFHFVLRHHDLY